MLVHQRNPVRVELFSYVKTFIGFMLHISCTKINWASEVKLHVPSFDLIQQKAALVFVEEKRVHNMQPNYRFLFVQKVI